jgi:16S rRNA (uracil1498-N3)-methyltransferase
MAMLPRFFAPALDPDRSDVVLPPEESHHLARVLRLGTRDEVSVFDGRGHEYRARIVDASRHAARLALMAPAAPAPESAVPIVLVQAILKSDSMDGVVRDATVLGVSTIVPVITAHLAASRRGLESGKVVDRWRRVALAAAKQCRRAVLPAVLSPEPFDRWLDRAAAGLRLMLTEPSAPIRPRLIREFLPGTRPEQIFVIAGPEGGWAGAEIDRAVSSGCAPVTLGGVTLRAELAPVVALSMTRVVFDL